MEIALGAILILLLALAASGVAAFGLGQWHGAREARRQLGFARTLGEVMAATTVRPDLLEALGVLLRQTAEGLAAVSGSVHLTGEAGGLLRLAHAVGLEDLSRLAQVSLRDPLLRDLWASPDGLIVASPNSESAWSALAAGRQGRTLVAALLGDKAGRLGVLALAWPDRQQAEASVVTVLSVGRYARQVLVEFRLRDQAAAGFQLLSDDLQHVERLGATLAHDMLNRLGALELLLNLQRDDGADGGRAQVDEMLAHLGVVNAIGEELRDFGQARAIQPERVPVETLVELLPSLMARRIKGPQIAFELNMPAGLPDVWGERVRLLRVLDNLLRNAVKYNRPGGRVWLAARRAGDQIEFEVGDTGFGVPASALPRLFDFGYRAPGHESKGMPGHGIGLWSCRQIVEAHGGRIWVDSAPEAGSRFHFTVPIARDETMTKDG